jgi:hypothetical protein
MDGEEAFYGSSPWLDKVFAEVAYHDHAQSPMLARVKRMDAVSLSWSLRKLSACRGFGQTVSGKAL